MQLPVGDTLSSPQHSHGSLSSTRSCGAELDKGLPARPWNCTYGAKSPLCWLQEEGNNVFEGYYPPPYYLDLYNFQNGAQNDIFEGDVITTPLPPSPSTPSSTSSPAQGVAHARAAYADSSPRDGEGTYPLHTPKPLPGYSKLPQTQTHFGRPLRHLARHHLHFAPVSAHPSHTTFFLTCPFAARTRRNLQDIPLTVTTSRGEAQGKLCAAHGADAAVRLQTPPNFKRLQGRAV
jgi:hypothetical protein